MSFVLNRSRNRFTQAKYFGLNTQNLALTGLVKQDGSLPLTGDWNAGLFSILSKNSVDVFNVKAYGAVGDGSTDDTAAINSAITACIAAGAGIVFFPIGNYKITSALSIPSGTRGLSLVGVGGVYSTPGTFKASTIKWAGGATNMGSFLNTTDTVVSGICFDGGAVANASGLVFNSDNVSTPCSRTTIRNCMFRRLDTALILGNSAFQTDTIWISDCGFYEGTTIASAQAISMNCANLTARIQNCQIVGWRYAFSINACGNIVVDHVNGGNVTADTFDLFYLNGSYTNIEAVNCEAEGLGTVRHLNVTASATAGTSYPVVFRGSSLGPASINATANIVTMGCHYQGVWNYAAGSSKHLSVGDTFPAGSITGNVKPVYLNADGSFIGLTPSARAADWYQSAANTRVRVTGDNAFNPGYEWVQTGLNQWTAFSQATSNNWVLFESSVGAHLTVQPGASAAMLWTVAGQGMALPGVLFTQTADSTTTANTSSSLFGTGVGTLTLPASFLIAGRGVEIDMGGVMNVNDGGAGTKTLTLSLGGTTVATGASPATFSLTTTNQGWKATATILCRTVGAPGTVQASGEFRANVGANAENIVYFTSTTATNITTTGSLAVDLKYNNGNATGSLKTTWATVKILN